MSLQSQRLVNDTVVNVAQLMKELTGATRRVEVHLADLALDEDLTASDVEAHVRLTRTATGILADGRVAGLAELECVRCTERFTTAFDEPFDAEFAPTVDVRTGLPLPLPDDADDDVFMIDHNHELDLTEILRQVAILALPMQPLCREDCPGIGIAEEEEEPIDARLVVLGSLLDERAD